MLLALVLVAFALAGCKDNQMQQGREIKVRITSTTFKSASFTVESGAEEQIISYICDRDTGNNYDAQYIYDNGTKIAYTPNEIVIERLSQSTEYELSVVTLGTEGLSKAATVVFTTEENSGAPATPGSVGIRADNIRPHDVDVYFEMGAECSQFKTVTLPAAYVENYVFEQRKSNPSLTHDDILIPVVKEMGATYTESLMVTGCALMGNADALDPDLEYTTYCIGIGESEEQYLDFSYLTWSTAAMDRAGDPQVVTYVDGCGVMSAMFHFRPNNDCKYLRYLMIEESYYDEALSSPEFGEDLLLEVIRTYSLGCDVDAVKDGTAGSGDKHVWTDNEIQRLYNWGDLSFAGKKFVLLTLAYDANMMPAGELSTAHFQLEEPGTTIAEFGIKTTETGATFCSLSIDMEDPNCQSIAYHVVTPAEYEGYMSSLGAEGYARALHQEAWLIQKINGNYTKSEMWTDISPSTEYYVVGCSLSTDKKLSDPVVCDMFTTKAVTFGHGTGSCSITISDITRTSARMNMDYSENARLLYWVILYSSDELFDWSDEDISSWLMENGNIFTANLPSSVSHYVSTGMSPGTEYTLAYMIQDSEGGFSVPEEVSFTTESGGGGNNPEITVEIVEVTAKQITLNRYLNEDAGGYHFAIYEQDEYCYDIASTTEFFEKYFTTEMWSMSEGTRTWTWDMNGIKPGTTYYFCFAPASENVFDNPDATVGKKVILEITTPEE